MPDLKSQIKAAHRAADSGVELKVTEHHYQWMELPEDEHRWSDEAREFARIYFSEGFKHERKGRISASSIGSPCDRRMVLGYAGAGKVAPSLDTQGMMDAGSEAHFWWQMEGLTYPFGDSWLKQAEVWVHDPALRIGGSMDGLLWDDSILEVKTVNSWTFPKIDQNDAPIASHLMQVNVYFKLSGKEACSLVYVDRNSNKFREFRIYPDPAIMGQVESIIKRLGRYIDLDELPKMFYEADSEGKTKNDCAEGVGYVYKQCEHRKSCPRSVSVSMVS